MTTYSDNESIPIPRSRVFVLNDGTFVVQWEEKRVQILLSGKYLAYQDDDFGNPITNWELNQLKQAGIVESYDDELIHLSPLPSLVAKNGSRMYYLNTVQVAEHQNDVLDVLAKSTMPDLFTVRIKQNFVIVRGQNGAAFASFDDAERARELLVSIDSELFQQTVVAFVEITDII